MTGQVLVDSEAFKERFEHLAAKAKKSIYLQAMSFEGDSVGEWLIDTLIASPAEDIQLCLDSYSKFVINDQFIYSTAYLKDETFRAEVKNTSAIIKKARKNGIKVKYTNPLGFLFLQYPHRNHKKMVLIDEEIAFIGGLNFCEHNFEWHDMMVEMNSTAMNQSLSNDFHRSVAENDQSTVDELGDTKMYYLDGYRSKNIYKDIFRNIDEAKESIRIFSPYVSDPLLTYTRTHKAESVRLDIISPGINNKNVFKAILSNELMKGYFNFYEYQGRMSHLKAILIDDKKLICGSSNFDFISYYFEEEVVMITENQEIVQDFINKISKPDIANSLLKKSLGDTRSYVVPLLFAGISKLCHIVATIISVKYLFRKSDV
ncbi:MAG: phosphatidylserine/phosphatidylglycerophosphate/cardiolipin synthase family protein [Reichenbachiella sp.]|uniref:phospholipase D-like domain-containing protein n=1 Tax=Reichenbachiella sp. TaxID=2184521 RepID=UPI0032673503